MFLDAIVQVKQDVNYYLKMKQIDFESRTSSYNKKDFIPLNRKLNEF